MSSGEPNQLLHERHSALIISPECLQGFAFALSYHWAIGDSAGFMIGDIPAICTVQASFLQISNVLSAFFVGVKMSDMLLPG